MSRVEQWIEVAAPVERVFNSFSAVENFPRWMSNVRNVRRADAHRALLEIGPATHSKARQWEVETVAFEPPQRFAWRVVSGGTGAEMEATFEETQRGTTLMRVILGENPPTGQARTEEDAESFFDAHTAQALEESLARFKSFAEQQGAEATPAAQEDDEKTIVAEKRATDHSALRTLSDEPPREVFPARERQAAMPEHPPATTARSAIQSPRAGSPAPDATRAATLRPARRRIPPLYIGLAALLALAVIALLLFTSRQRSERAESGNVETNSVPTASPTIEAREPDNDPRDAAAINSNLPQPEITPDSTEQQNSDDTEPHTMGIGERDAPEGEQRTELRAQLDEWIAATNARDVDRQMNFYAPTVERYYRRNNFSRTAVREDKARLAGRASLVDVQIGEPEVDFDENGRAATMRFRKRYNIEGIRNSRGEVLQELRWAKTDEGWKIIGERDVRVIR
ncbi:MAG: SRPBCC family protein [Pyrinomonadaceae bacterium]|nr:SRPBCC family protein [Pyrinomonadaceae bacterium]